MPEEAPVDVANIRFGIKQVIAVIAVILTVMGSGYATYSGISSRIQTVDQQLQTQTKQIIALTETNEELERQMLELTVTLRVKGVIK